MASEKSLKIEFCICSSINAAGVAWSQTIVEQIRTTLHICCSFLPNCKTESEQEFYLVDVIGCHRVICLKSVFYKKILAKPFGKQNSHFLPH